MKARFSFAKGCKKASPQLVLAEPLKKAHKILGSTPINIDSPKPWDDASSGYSGGTGNSTIPSYASSDDFSDRHVAIAHSEDEWANDSEMRVAALKSSGRANESDHALSEATRALQRTQSTSTIRSGHDASKQPLPISHSASTASIIKGVPAKIHKLLNSESPTVLKTKKRPPMLDFSNLRTSRLSRKTPQGPLRTDATVLHNVENSTASLSASLITPTGKSRKIQKRNTKDNVISPSFEETKLSTLTGERRYRRPKKEAPSLYDHYEQMTRRQVRRETETPEGEHQVEGFMEEDEDDEPPWTAQDSPWLQHQPQTPQTAVMTGLTPAASHNRSNSATSKMTAGTKRSKNLDRSVLQDTSVILSDSEEDDEPAPVPQSQTASPNRHSSTATSRPQSSRTSSRASDHRPARHSKKTSFAPVNTYIKFPSSGRLSSDTAIPIESESRSSTPSSHMSLKSNTSSPSAPRPRAIYIQDTRAATMLAGRRPARVENSEGNIPDRVSSLTILPSAARRALAQTPPEELTPPLSPTSRSTRSSLDGFGSQNRYMVVSLEEEKMLSAYRNQKQPDKELPTETHQQPTQICSTDASPNAGTAEQDEVEDEADSFLGTKRSFFENALDASASMSSRASTATSDKLSQSSIAESEDMEAAHQPSLAASAMTQQPFGSILKNPGIQHEKPEQQVVPLYLDEAGRHDFSEFGCLIVPPLQRGHSRNSVHSYSPVRDTKPTQTSPSPSKFTAPDSNLVDYAYRPSSTMPSVPEDSELEYESQEIPRPDSPMDLDAFPTVPQVRTTLSSMTRLSAFGPVPMMNPGLWGDDG